MAASILITGGAGFIGLALAERLLADGHRVVLLDRRAPPFALTALLPGAAERLVFHEGDMLDGDSLRRALTAEAVELVVHAAAITADAARERSDPGSVIRVNLEGLADVIVAAKHRTVRRLLLVGSAAVFGAASGGRAQLTEATPVRPDSLYAITKAAGEQILRRLGAVHGLAYVIARLGWVFGPWEHASGVRDTLSPIHRLTALARAGRPAMLPRQDRRDWLYSRDAARRLAALLLAPRLAHDTYHLGAGRRLPLTVWCERLAWRLPDFSWSVGGPGEPVPLHSEADGPVLSCARFRAEFPEAAARTPTALDDYLAWLESADACALPLTATRAPS